MTELEYHHFTTQNEELNVIMLQLAIVPPLSNPLCIDLQRHILDPAVEGLSG